MHLLLIGVRNPDESPDSADMNMVAHKIRQTSTFKMARIRTTEQIFDALDQVTAHGEVKLETLDFYDHASEGVQLLGLSHIFSRGPRELDGELLLKKLVPYLSATASIRLLGCFVGSARKGSWLIQSLEEIAGEQRRVFGTTIRMNQSAFGRGGLRPHHAATSLYPPPTDHGGATQRTPSE